MELVVYRALDWKQILRIAEDGAVTTVVIFFVAGMFIDPNSILLVPTLFPVATALGVDPIHFGLIVCLNICIGMITPPFGRDLFVASGTLKRPVEAVIAGIGSFTGVNLVVLVIIPYVPSISTALPKLLL